jgi:pimeloyl-ACP methyl ester carboxylesterase
MRKVNVPVLMLNGQFDNLGPLETSVRPFFALLGTAEPDKRHVVTEGGHFVPRAVLIRETLDWLDKYQGRPGS